MKKITEIIIKVFDYFDKKKILKFFGKQSQITSLIDIGAHRGETISFFCNSFDKLKIIYSFEPVSINYKKLLTKVKKINKKFPKIKILLYKIAAGNSNGFEDINILSNTQSSTIQNLNYDSVYFKRKDKLLNIGKNKIKEKIKVITLKKFLLENKIKQIDLLKIDTEGYEYDVLLGLGNRIEDFKYIYFEHHFNNMIIKNYTFTKIHTLLKSKQFSKVFKLRMSFRKTFEYVYANNRFIDRLS